jgi:hypothetical protein
MNLLDTATQTPLVFHLLEHHRPDAPDFIAAISDIESVLVRRFICGLTTKAYNRIFLNRLLAEMIEEGKADAAALRLKLLELDGDSQRWPKDDEFTAAWSRRQLYRGSSTRKVRTITSRSFQTQSCEAPREWRYCLFLVVLESISFVMRRKRFSTATVKLPHLHTTITTPSDTVQPPHTGVFGERDMHRDAFLCRAL